MGWKLANQKSVRCAISPNSYQKNLAKSFIFVLFLHSCQSMGWQLSRDCRAIETERERERETERQKEKEKERQRDRETERQREGPIGACRYRAMNPFTVQRSLALWWRNNQQRCIDALATGPGDQFSSCEIVHRYRENMTITDPRWRAPACYKRAFSFLPPPLPTPPSFVFFRNIFFFPYLFAFRSSFVGSSCFGFRRFLYLKWSQSVTTQR